MATPPLPAGYQLDQATAPPLPAGYRLDSPQPAKQPGVMDVLTQPTEKTDQEFMGYRGPAGVAGATIHGLNNVARDTAGAVSGIGHAIAHPIDTASEMFRGAVSLPSEIASVPSAVHDINESPDPLTHYADAAEDTASQGAGQALTAIGTEGLVRTVPRIVPPLTRLGSRSAEAAINQKLVPVRSILNLNTPADEAAATQIKVPGRDFGIAKPLYPGAPLPANPPAEVGMARGLSIGARSIADPSAGLGQIPIAQPGAAGSMMDSVVAPSGDPILQRLRVNAARIAEEGHGDEIPQEQEAQPITTNLNQDLTPALKASLAKVRAAKRIARVN